jgi:hypothetical protein
VKINNFVPWRPVLKQLPPPRSKKLVAEIDPEPTLIVHRSGGNVVISEGTVAR